MNAPCTPQTLAEGGMIGVAQIATKPDKNGIEH
jgi:hypothetical protein